MVAMCEDDNNNNILDVLVVGGGLSGVMICHGFEKSCSENNDDKDIDWKLLDARKVLGGRLCNDSAGDGIDLGAAWIWPNYQPIMKKLLKEMSIPTFAQPGDPSAVRVVGGAIEIIHRIVQELPSNRIELNTPVISCTLCTPASNEDNINGNYVRIETAANDTEGNKTTTYLAKHVVFALPPVLLSKNVRFIPPLSNMKQNAMNASQTWMAGVTKISLLYSEKFWDSECLDVSLVSGHGPAFQVHDASTVDGTVHALTCFAHVIADSPEYTSDSILAEKVSKQLSNVMFKKSSTDSTNKTCNYTGYYVKRWPNEEYISENDKPTMINPHPKPCSALSQTEWNNMLHFAGTETDLHSPGVLQGAAGSAIRVLKELKPLLLKK